MATDDLVLSVPAGKTYDLILKHFIYSCPDLPAWFYKPTEFIAFRTAEDYMERIFNIAQVIKVNPLNIATASELSESIRIKIRNYIDDAKPRSVMEKSGNYRFYILHEKDVVKLPHSPHTKDRLQGAHYFSFKQLTSDVPLS